MFHSYRGAGKEKRLNKRKESGTERAPRVHAPDSMERQLSIEKKSSFQKNPIYRGLEDGGNWKKMKNVTRPLEKKKV